MACVQMCIRDRCIELVEEIGVKLGRHVAGLINIFNTELVIIGGASVSYTHLVCISKQVAVVRMIIGNRLR